MSDKEEIKKRLRKVAQDQRRAQEYISNNENIVLMNLSKDKEDIALYNAVLSDEVKILDKDKIESAPDKPEKNKFFLNGACLDVSTIEPLPLETKEEKEKQLSELNEEMERLKGILGSIDKKEEIAGKLSKCEKQLHKVQSKLQEVENIEQYKADHTLLQERIEDNDEKLTFANSAIDILGEEIIKISRRLAEVSSKIDALEEDGRRVYGFKETLEKAYGFIPKFEGIEAKTKLSEALENIETWQPVLYKKIDESSRKKDAYTFAVDHAKGELRGIEGIEEKENDAFLSLLDDKCYGLDIREKDFIEMVKAGHHIFFQHIKRFLGEIETIETYIRRI